MASLAPELESRQAQAIDQAQQQVKQTLEASLAEFEQRLQATATQAHQSASEQLKTEALASLAPDLESRQAQAIDQAQQEVKHTLEAALAEFEQRLQATATQAHQSASEQLRTEALANLAPELESRQAQAIHQAQQQVKQTLEAALVEFEQRLQATATQAHQSASEQLRTEALANLAPELESRHSKILQQTNDLVQRDLANALSSFQADLSTASAQAHQEAMERLSGETLAGLSAQLEVRQLEVVKQAQEQIACQFQSSFEEFGKRMQTAAAQTESAAMESLRTEFIAALKPELEVCQTDNLQQARRQTQQTMEAALGEFRQQLQLTAGQAQETATERLSAGILTKLVPQLEARQSETLDETRQRVKQTLEHSLHEFNARLETAAEQAQQTASEHLTAHVVSQLQPEIESRQNAAVSQAAERIQETLSAGLDGFERSLQAATAQVQQAALEQLTSEAQVKLAPVLEAQKTEVLENIRHESAAAVESSVRSLREHMALEVAECQKSADSLLQKPSEIIRKYAEDTVAMLREEMIAERVSTVESAKLEVRAMMRSTLTSLNEEASAFTAEFRDQIKSAWESMKIRGLDELESLHQEAISKHRESILERLQKDAEDLTHVAVGHFRAQSEEAIREANNAINKQVGAAAFLLKDWMDQATTRLERCLEKVETRAETAFEAAQARSLKTQMGMMERVQRESEEIALELHDRFQQAASALRKGQPRMAEGPAQPGGNSDEETKILHVPSGLEG